MAFSYVPVRWKKLRRRPVVVVLLCVELLALNGQVADGEQKLGKVIKNDGDTIQKSV